jgi:hypothetical protein
MSDQHKKCHPSLNSQRQRWAGIVLFVGVPWVFIYTLIAFGIDLPSEIVLKDSIFRSRPRVDTVVVGDSRVLRLNEEAFQAKGWAFFNMGLSGMSPEDVALQLGYALSRGTIRRVVMGVSFESLSEKYAFEHSRYYLDEPFMRAGVSDLAGTPPAAVVGRAVHPAVTSGDAAASHVTCEAGPSVFPPKWKRCLPRTSERDRPRNLRLSPQPQSKNLF